MIEPEPCEYCDDHQYVSRVSLMWHCEKCGSYWHAEPVHDVYDTAMAYHHAVQVWADEDFKSGCWQEVEVERLRTLLHDACRRAKEGHG